MFHAPSRGVLSQLMNNGGHREIRNTYDGELLAAGTIFEDRRFQNPGLDTKRSGSVVDSHSELTDIF